MSANGLPVDEPAALELIAESAGPRPTSWAHEDEIRAVRDGVVFDQLEPRHEVNLRNPAEVKRMLERQGFDLPDTRAWRLEQLRETEPLIDALLTWRKAERIATLVCDRHGNNPPPCTSSVVKKRPAIVRH